MLEPRLIAARSPLSLGSLLTGLALITLCPRSVQANGAFPAVSQLVSDPSDQTHLVLRSNFGLLITHDRGASWDWVCEAGLGYQNVEPPIAVLGDGTTIAALPNGIVRGDTECSFGLANGISSYVADVARVPSDQANVAAVAVSVQLDEGVSQVWRSLDAGNSWNRWGSALSDFNATTLDAAADDRSTLYVSGVSQSDAVTGQLARSTDGGQTWTRWSIPGVNKASAPYIAAIAASDASTVYVRLSGSPGKLLVSRDGGEHWAGVLDFEGPLDGFALSPDGRYALASGRADGVWRARTSELSFERVSCTKLRCLSWSNSGLFGCADEYQTGFLVGQSTDLGATFETRLNLSCVRGPLACGSDSGVAQACDASWPAQSEILGSDCANAGFTLRDDCSHATSGTSGAAGMAGANDSGAGAGNTLTALHTSGGCSMNTSSTPRSALLVLLAAALAAVRRRTGRPRKAR
jgi:photosystem II stability/assembly factor-like uncharacterized protein